VNSLYETRFVEKRNLARGGEDGGVNRGHVVEVLLLVDVGVTDHNSIS